MSMFPFVKKGDPFKPNASFDNACRGLVNSFSAHGNPALKKGYIQQTKVQCYNPTTSKISIGSSVCFDDKSAVVLDTVLPIKICDDVKCIWGVLDCDVEPGTYGTVTISGVTNIKFQGSEAFVEPDLKGGYVGSKSGTAQVLYKLKNGESVVLLGSLCASKEYNGPFAFSNDNGKLKVKGGPLNRNGKMFDVKDTVIDQITDGEVCVTSRFDTKSNTWADPKIEFAKPASDAYPIGSCKKIDDSNFMFECYEVPYAIIIYTKECPLAAKNNR